MSLLSILAVGVVAPQTGSAGGIHVPGVGSSGSFDAGGALLGLVVIVVGFVAIFYAGIAAITLLKLAFGTTPGRVVLGLVIALAVAFSVIQATTSARPVVAGSPAPEATPDIQDLSLKQTLDVFYGLVRTHQLRMAHSMLSQSFREQLTFETFRAGYGDVRELSWELDEVAPDRVGARVTARVGDTPSVFSHVMWHGIHDEILHRWILDEADPVRT